MNHQVFAWRSGNRFELLLDGPQFFPRLLAAIAAAEQQVELELYLVEDGACATELVAALTAAARRGVRVRCLFDGFGCLAFGESSRQRLAEAGVELRLYNPLSWRRGLLNLYRDHRKLLLVDQHLGFVGGTGATDEFWQPGSETCWHELMVQMQGPLLQDWRQLFERQWQASEGRRAWRPHLPLRRPSLPAIPPLGPGLGRVAYADAEQHRDILQSLVRNLLRARRTIWLATPYFLPTWRVRRALRRAAKRGVDVRLLLTGRNTDHAPVRYAGRRYYPRLLKAGVRIFEYQPRFLHLKMVLVDDWVSLGSCNFDHWNLRWNLDANLEALDPQLADEAAASFMADFAQAEEVTLAGWRATPLGERIRTRLWGWLDRLVINLFDQRR